MSGIDGVTYDIIIIIIFFKKKRCKEHNFFLFFFLIKYLFSLFFCFWSWNWTPAFGNSDVRAF